MKRCWKCHTRLLKERHPETYALNALRSHARRRKVPFSLTLAEFREFCEKTGYLEERGLEPWSATVGRINHDEGYHLWNIRVESHAKNSQNGHTVPGRNTAQNARANYAIKEEVDEADDPGIDCAPATQTDTGSPF